MTGPASINRCGTARQYGTAYVTVAQAKACLKAAGYVVTKSKEWLAAEAEAKAETKAAALAAGLPATASARAIKAAKDAEATRQMWIDLGRPM